MNPEEELAVAELRAENARLTARIDKIKRRNGSWSSSQLARLKNAVKRERAVLENLRSKRGPELERMYDGNWLAAERRANEMRDKLDAERELFIASALELTAELAASLRRGQSLSSYRLSAMRREKLRRTAPPAPAAVIVDKKRKARR
jgi:hypothetical protein